jgi:TetR/AcrR family transcriptional regulator
MAPDDRREEIVAAARAVFSESGPLGTTMRNVADRAGITETHLYRYFRKQDLYQQAVIDPLEELGRQLVDDTHYLLQRPDVQQEELLEHFHELCLAYFVALAPLLRASNLPGQGQGEWPQPQDMFPRWREVVEAVIGDVTGWGSALNVDVMVQALMGLYQILAIESVLEDRTLNIRRTAQQLTRMFAPTRLTASERRILKRAADRNEQQRPARLEALAAAAHPPEDIDGDAPRKRMRKAERQESILLAARSLFGEVGFDGARSKDIAERAGITETFLYRHFGSKEEIYELAVAAPAEGALVRHTAATQELANKYDGVRFVNEFNEVALRFYMEYGSVLATATMADLERSRRFYKDRLLPQLDALGRILVAKLGYDEREVDQRVARRAIVSVQWAVATDFEQRFPDTTIEDVALYLTRLFTAGVVPKQAGAR